MSDILTILLAILGAVSAGSGVSWFLIRANQRKIDAERAKILADARATDKTTDADYSVKLTNSYDKLAVRLTDEGKELRDRIKALEADHTKDMERLDRLEADGKRKDVKIRELSKKYSELLIKTGKLEVGIDKLTAQIQRANLVPDWVREKDQGVLETA